MSRRLALWLTWTIGGAALALSISAAFLIELNGGNIGSAYATVPAIWGISFSAVGALIVSRRPENAIGWIFLLGGFFSGLNAFSSEYAAYALVTDPGPWPGGAFFSWLFAWVFAPGFVTFPPHAPALPDGSAAFSSLALRLVVHRGGSRVDGSADGGGRLAPKGTAPHRRSL